MAIRYAAHVDDLDSPKIASPHELSKRMTVRCGMSRADFEGATIGKVDLNHEMVCHGIALCAPNRHGLDRAFVHAIYEIAFDERINAFFAARRGDGRLGRSAFARCASRRTRAIGIRRVAAKNDADGTGNTATKFPRRAAIAPTTRAPWTAKRPIAWWYGANPVITIRLHSITFLATRSAIVDVVIEVGAGLTATNEIAETARSAARTARTRGAPQTPAAPISTSLASPAIAPHSNGPTISARATRRRRRARSAGTAPVDRGAAAGNEHSHQA